MAITHEREDIRTAIQLKEEGWIAEIVSYNNTNIRNRADWCREAFGPMYSQLHPNAWSGKWYGAELPSQTDNKVRSQVLFMFRDEKLYTMYKMMFSENESTM